MKHMKLFEDLNNEPQIGDYILVHIDDVEDSGFSESEIEYLNTNLCKVINVRHRDDPTNTQYQIELGDWIIDIDDDIENEVWLFGEEIIWFGKEYMDPNIIIDTIKYNL